MKTWSVAICPSSRQYRYHPRQCQPQSRAWLYCNQCHLAPVTALKRDFSKVMVVRAITFGWQFLMAYGNYGLWLSLRSLQTFMPYARGWKNALGRMHKVHSRRYQISLNALPRFAYCSSFAPLNLFSLLAHH